MFQEIDNLLSHHKLFIDSLSEKAGNITVCAKNLQIPIDVITDLARETISGDSQILIAKLNNIGTPTNEINYEEPV